MRTSTKLKLWIEKRSPAQVIAGYYFLAMAISVLLFSIPAVRKPGVHVSFFDTVFTAVSVASDTGLAVFNVADTYSVWGYVVIMIVLQFGGIGIMAMSTFFWLLLGRRIGLRQRRLIMMDNNQFELSGLVHLMREILVITLLTQLIGGVVLGIRFLSYYETWQDALLQGLFASVSATTNAGMDITGQSLTPYANDYFVQLVTIVLIIFGAIGFPVLIEAKAYLTHLRKGDARAFRFSLFTKITTVTYAFLLVLGTILMLLFENERCFKDMSWHESFFYALFQTATTRSAGLTTLDINQLSVPTLLLMSIFMFIGGSPNSVGGGIRTTTFALNMLFIYQYARGYQSIKLFRREIHQEDILKALAITLLATVMCVVSVIAISLANQHLPLIGIILEVCSAFGTVGLSTGITPELGTFSQTILMVLMFLGRIGLTTCFFFLRGKQEDAKYHYPVERIMTG
ncbi:TrkH family potassium uptake protein [Paenibacillus cremeus]|uniref:TrkH family potassium uptake protein n=1 Tax=Paenibacillus cremeus TaxID=2163881 RepID=A0A559KGU9_9BACL|nr:TrkH family potassium uptake protein [Paenibacillus cremeus]TVY11341.1 TrkH family potassium uptake protein [Paenibacillus cremeus]